MAEVDFAAIGNKLGMPAENVAQIAGIVREHGMEDGQMASMMCMASERGVSAEEIRDMLTGVGVPTEQVVRVMQAEGLMDPEEATRIIEAERAAVETEAGTGAAGGKRRRYVRRALILVFWFAVWEALDRIADNRLILAGPIRTLQAVGDQVVRPDFWVIVGASFGRITLGFLLSFIAGFLLALAAHRSHLFREFVDPVMSLLRTIPVASFII